MLKAAIFEEGADGTRRLVTTARWLSPIQVAWVLGVGKSTVYRMIEDGRLPAVRHGATYRLTPEDVLDYLRRASEW